MTSLNIWAFLFCCSFDNAEKSPDNNSYTKTVLNTDEMILTLQLSTHAAYLLLTLGVIFTHTSMNASENPQEIIALLENNLPQWAEIIS